MMKSVSRRLWALTLGALLLAGHAVASESHSLPGASGPAVKAEMHPISLRSGKFDPHQALTLELAAPASAETAKLQSGNRWGRQTIGFARELASSSGPLKLGQGIEWRSMDDEGQAGLIRVRSAGAMALRLGLEINRLPEGTELRFASPEHPEIHRVTGAEILDLIAANVRAGDVSSEARTYWSPVTEGEVLDVEIYLPSGIDRSAIDVVASQVSHLVWSPISNRQAPGLDSLKFGGSGSCNLDIMCHNAGNELRRSVARMVFSVGGGSYLCSGTLLNSNDAQFTPYFLTAHHCIENQTEASSLNTFWFYHASSCNSGVLSSSSRQLAGGSVLLKATPSVDTTLLRLNNAAPNGAWFAGWNAGLAGASASTTAVHHPAGDLQKISFGNIAGFADCGSDPSNLDCSYAPQASSNFLVVVHSQGTTEGGSSGSSIFNSSGQVIGTLLGGGASCQEPELPDLYGRFDLAYQSGNLAQWLTPSTSANTFDPAYGGLWFNAAQAGHGFSVTIHSDESATVFWYTYDQFGYPMWLLGSGSIVENRIEAQAYHAHGMTFGNWNPNDFQLLDWGTFNITFHSCDQATLDYQGTLVFDGESFGSGSMPLERLAFTDGLSCED